MGGELMDKVKKTHVCSVKCPHCEGLLDIYKETKTLVPAQKAEKEEIYIAKKITQTQLG